MRYQVTSRNNLITGVYNYYPFCVNIWSAEFPLHRRGSLADLERICEGSDLPDSGSSVLSHRVRTLTQPFASHSARADPGPPLVNRLKKQAEYCCELFCLRCEIYTQLFPVENSGVSTLFHATIVCSRTWPLSYLTAWTVVLPIYAGADFEGRFRVDIPVCNYMRFARPRCTG